MKNKKQGIAIIEILMYIFIFVLIGLNILVMIRYFLNGIDYNIRIEKFSHQYDSMIHKMYENSIKDYNLLTGESTNEQLVLSNGQDYIGYDCDNEGLSITKASTGANLIDWSEYQDVYTGFKCLGLTGWLVDSGYWLDYKIGLLGFEMDLKYLFISR